MGRYVDASDFGRNNIVVCVSSLTGLALVGIGIGN